MSRIIPAILEQDQSEVVEKLKKVQQHFDFAQIDIVDGVYVPNTTFPYKDDGEFDKEADISNITDLNIDFEIDGMTCNHIEAARFWKRKGAKRYILHIDASLHYVEDIKAIKEIGINVCIALLPNETLYTIDKVRDMIDGVQCMGIDQVGIQGQPFDRRVIELIKAIKDKYPQMKVGVDGSVNKNTLKDLVLAGADTFSIGSALLNGDIEENKKELEDIIKSCG